MTKNVLGAIATIAIATAAALPSSAHAAVVGSQIQIGRFNAGGGGVFSPFTVIDPGAELTFNNPFSGSPSSYTVDVSESQISFVLNSLESFLVVNPALPQPVASFSIQFDLLLPISALSEISDSFGGGGMNFEGPDSNNMLFFRLSQFTTAVNTVYSATYSFRAGSITAVPEPATLALLGLALAGLGFARRRKLH